MFAMTLIVNVSCPARAVNTELLLIVSSNHIKWIFRRNPLRDPFFNVHHNQFFSFLSLVSLQSSVKGVSIQRIASYLLLQPGPFAFLEACPLARWSIKKPRSKLAAST
ncbi:hypothetical protein BDV12DRAFT_41204 [Aspergillus spectabilis]